MKKIVGTFLFLGVTCLAIGQDMSKLFNSQEFVWCGLDFSMVKCIGPAGFTDPEAIKDKYFGAWNDLMIAEADKYDFKETYRKSKRFNDLSVTDRRNELPDANQLVITNDYSFEEGQLEKIVKDYSLENHKEGLGLVYIFEALNKTEQRAVIYAVFFDIATKEIVWSNKYSPKARGFGFRNYWAGSVYAALRLAKYDYKNAIMTYKKSMKKKK